MLRKCTSDSLKSSLINAAFCTSLSMHVSQGLVGKGKKGGLVLISTILQQHWIEVYCLDWRCSHQKHQAGRFFVLSIQKKE